MKTCTLCGAENEDTATICNKCSSPFAPGIAPKPRLQTERYEFATLDPAEKESDLVTLLTCPTLPEADLIVSLLESAGMPASNPDAYRMVSGPFELDQLYKFRVQVPPEHFEAARDFLLAEESAGGESERPEI